ncbi:TlpA family protein disulfide reductase [Tissierella creatinophila]|uniref:Thiol-disulfide oxidoreductase ResA n=1 Tax=Tissierella creatinophila DSM 6911 TaxID=1123403 RepID=A0A1U7M2R9_TISCR|nr:TlpA disulfide reductase family protein [Tissierella creatinophila]OLS01488.1 thiol-disulfide oxidoreductase ResA [Tissierella creatinophila DSM 6911]
MKKNWIYIILIILLVAGFFYLVLERPKPVDPETKEDQGQVDKPDDTIVEPPEDNTPAQTPELGKALPDFTLKNLDGKDVTLSDVKDKIILVNFWASWCTWCDKEMPDLQKLKEENNDLVVLAVNVEEPKATAQEYIKKGGYDFEVLLDEDGEIAAQYLVSGLPASYFVDKDGKFVGRVPSAITYEQMNEILEDIRGQ